ncbi:hypothetical protein [Desulfogranum japonicum]|uniref:hypothetical protein n=1 Tax=Desulfogranum japonicum TaxID=231447 RepID=UPI000415F1BD|nr:hypothetical protein [Desulfogranum japonicum]
MPLHEEVMAGIARKTGLSPEQIRKSSPEEIRAHLTKKTKKDFKITSAFPFIGRGNVLRDKLRSSKDINRETDKILGL